MTTRSLRRLFALFLIVNLLIVGWALTHRRTHELTITFLDVGRGDGCVIEVSVCGMISVRRLVL